MSAEEFTRLCNLIFGEGHEHSSVATALGVTRDTVKSWKKDGMYHIGPRMAALKARLQQAISIIPESE